MELKFTDKLKVSLHNHSLYSRDSKTEPEEFIKEAVRQNLEIIGISEHCPLPFWFEPCGMLKEKVNEYFEVLNKLKKKYEKQIRVLIGMEVDYLHFNSDFTLSVLKFPLDYTIGSVHSIKDKNRIWCVDLSEEEFEGILKTVFKGNIKNLCQYYFQLIIEAVKIKKFDILGHFDLIKKFNKNEKYFSEKEVWYQKMIGEVLKEIGKSKIIVEVNTAGLDRPVGEPYPSEWIIKKLKKMQVPLLLSADAHEASLITRHFSEVGKIIC